MTLLFKSQSIAELRNSFTFKMLKVVFSIYLVVTIILTIIHMWVEFQNSRLLINKELIRLEETFRPSLGEALWKLDNDLIRSVVKKIMKNHFVVGVSIVSNGKNTWIWEEGVVQDKKDDNIYIGDLITDKMRHLDTQLIVHGFQISYQRAGNNEQLILGQARFYSSQSMVFERVKLSFIFILANAMIKTLVLWYLLIWGGAKFLAKPLRKFTKSVQEINLENLDEIHVVDSSGHENELIKLQNSFNKMTRNLRLILLKQQKAQKALETSEKYLQEVFNAMPSVLISVNQQHKITHINKAAEKFLHITIGEALGLDIKDILQDFVKYFTLIDVAIKKQEVQKIDKMKRHQEQGDSFHTLTIYPIHVAGSGSVIRIDDISDKVYMESIMVQTEKMTSLGTLAAGMAHEINNPLGGILQGLQNVYRRLDVNLPKNQEMAKKCDISLEKMHQYMQERGILQFLQGMRDLGERAASIVKNVLKFSRRSDTKMTQANVNDMIKDTISIALTDYDIKKQTSLKELSISTQLDENIPPVFCSAPEIEQVLLNLIKNAAHAVGSKKYSDGKCGNIYVRSFFGSGFVRIEVEDNGSGIDEFAKKRLFEPFFTTKPVGIGTGLGLSISYYIIVDKHMGQLLVESEKNVGTKFTIILPINQINLSDEVKGPGNHE